MAYDNTNRFVLFKNKDKRDDKDRDYNGTVNINGIDYWLNGYIKQSDKGAFISGTVISQRAMPRRPGTVKPKDAAGQGAASISQRAMPRRPDPISTGRPDMDDDIPFLMEWR